MSPVADMEREDAIAFYLTALDDYDVPTLRELCLTDVFFLLYSVFRRVDINQQWLFERCREVEADPDGRLDLWAREHYKSTIITYALTIQDILKNRNITVGIFSCTRPLAKGFLSQIMTELADNELLKALFPEVLYANPKREAPSWSLDNGITVKRDIVSTMATVEAWGMVEGMPTGKHFALKVYDDVITERHVTTSDMLKKVQEQWALSLNLGARGGRTRYVGTRYHFNDTYRLIIEREAAVPRIHAATDDGTLDGKPVFLTREELIEKRTTQGSYVFACQQLMNPVADSAQGFREEWLRYYHKPPRTASAEWNVYLMCDPANEKKKDNDYTVMAVVALGTDMQYYLIDGVRARMNLTERTNEVFRLQRKYRPRLVGYEKYGMQADIQHIQYVMEEQQYRFEIRELGGGMPKNNRIRRLVPIFEYGRMWFPHRLLFKDPQGVAVDWVHEFVTEEFDAFPVAVHDDMLDCLSRIDDPAFEAVFPKEIPPARGGQEAPTAQTEYDPFAA